MFKAERLARVARAIDDELLYQRHGLIAAGERAAPTAAIVALAEAAILAADGDEPALDQRRATRAAYQARLLGTTEPVSETP